MKEIAMIVNVQLVPERTLGNRYWLRVGGERDGELLQNWALRWNVRHGTRPRPWLRMRYW